MIHAMIWTLFLGTLVANVALVNGQCDPNHAVVAVASILSTLAVVTLVLIGIYFFLRRRKQVQKVPQSWNKTKSRRDGNSNEGFTYNDEFIAIEGVPLSTRRNQTNSREQVQSKDKKGETPWPSASKSRKRGKSKRGGSHWSLDEALNFADPEVISVSLESQDIIGLGFNICGSYGEGIRVSEVHNRGPAKESGVVKVGDRILSVTVSYENIVYEDALTILSYASPYPVKIVLEKVTDSNLKNLVDETQKGSLTQRIKHPLYHSWSLDTLKSVAHNKSSAHPKRAHTDLKLDSVKHFLKWHSKNSKKGQKSSDKDGDPLSKQFQHRNGVSALEDMDLKASDKEVLKETPDKNNSQNFNNSFVTNSYQNKNYSKAGFVKNETMAEVISTFDRNFDVDIDQKSPPDKPERKKRRASDVPNSYSTLASDNDQVLPPSTTAFSYSISSVTDDEIDVDEILISPQVTTATSYDDECDNKHEDQSYGNKKLDSSLEFINGNDFTDHVQPRLSPWPEVDPADETAIKTFNNTETSFPSSHDNDSSSNMQDTTINNSKFDGEIQNTPTFDDDAWKRIIAKNTFASDNQDWADVIAGEHEESILDDFVANHPLFMPHLKQKSNGEAISHETRFQEPLENNIPDPLEGSVHKSNLVCELRDEFMTGNLVPVETNKQINGVQTKTIELQPPIKHFEENNFVSLPTSTSSVSSQSISHSSDSSTDRQGDTNDGSEISDTLEWSGTRLVRSESFSNIFVND